MAQPPTFEGRADVVLVEVPVHVLADGEPLRGLTRDHFVVTEGRRRIPIVGFEVVDLTLSDSGRFWDRETTRALSAAARRHFLFLFDLSFSDPGAVLRARDAAKDLVLSGLHPADLAGVATWSDSRGAQLVLNFTADRRQILAAIDGLGVADPIDVPRDPLKVVVSELAAALDAYDLELGNAEGMSPAQEALLERKRLLAQMWLDSLVDQGVLATRTVREQQQRQIMSFSRSMLDVASLLRGVDGSTHVVLLSEGFDSSALLGATVADEASRARMEEIQRAVEDGQSWRVDSDERFGNSMALFGLTSTLEAFRRAGAAIQAIDIGGLRAQENEGSALRDAQTRQDGLFILANDTGGDLYRNYNRLSEAMSDLLTRTSLTYLLALQPEVEPDGAYHRIDVRLKDEPKGVRLIHRPGYIAPLPWSDRDATGRRQDTADLLFGSGDGGTLAAAVLAAPIPGSGGRGVAPRVWVPVLIEVGGGPLLAASGGAELPLELYAYALRQDGSVADFFAQALSIDRTPSQGALVAAGFKFWGNLDLPPGAYRVRCLAREGTSGAFALRTAELEVPDPASSGPFLLPPLVPEPPGKWVLAQEQTDGTRPSFPFVRGGEVFLPAVVPVLERGARINVVLAGTGFEPTNARVALELVPGRGGPSAAVAFDRDHQNGRTRPEILLASLEGSFEVPDLEGGLYRLRATLEPDAGETPITSGLAVEVR